MTMEHAKEIAILFCALCGMAGLIISLICVAMVAGFLRSTHTVQYLPHDNTDAFKPEPDLAAENEAALLNQVGRKKKPERPTVVEDLDAPLEAINQTDITF